MNRFKIKIWGPYSFENFYYAPDVYLFALLSSFAGMLSFVVILADVSDVNFNIASEGNVLRYGFTYISSVVSHDRWWGAFLLLAIAITLPIPNRVGLIILMIGTVYYSIDIKNIINKDDLEVEIIWVIGIMTLAMVVSWIIFKWWYWAGFGFEKNKRKRSNCGGVK